MNKWLFWVLGGLAVWLFSFASIAAVERDAKEAEAAATVDDREGQAYVPERPKNMPDLTKGDPLPGGKSEPVTWNLGPTGIIGVKNGGFGGDQVQVVAVLPGSPAEGKLLPGDVILGVSGKDFVVGGHLGVTIGNAIIKAEEDAGKGVLALHVWRDLNWTRRAAGKNVAGVDIDELFKQAEGSSDVYEWEGEKQRKAEVAKAMSSEFPIVGVHTNFTLQLRVMGTYSETSPWDCPVTRHVLEDAWKVIENTFKPDKQGRTTAGWRDVLALVASGKPEYRELVRKWVRTQKLCQDMKAEVVLKEGGMLSWHRGFGPLEMAIYYDATGDDYVLPELRYRAIETAMGQSGGGSWGHTFSFPSVNGGELHGRCPGYGGMNNAGSRCFFLLTLAQKAGIKDPEIDAAIVRATRFFGTYVDKGCIPYGDHSPYPSDDSNGKNYGAAYAFYTLGMPYEAKYFAMHSCNASFTPRGGHGSPVLWQYTPLSSHITGPEGVQAAMRNMRWFYTLARRHDGSFVIQSEQGGVGAHGHTGASPTAMYALYHSAPLKQLIITGKDANTNCWFNDKELDQLLVGARPQMNDPVLLARSGKPWSEQSTGELLNLLGHFYPNVRRGVAAELGKRYQAGEKEIAAKAVAALDDPEARVRHGACLSLAACGPDVALGSLSKFVKLLEDPAEFVRMGAVDAIGVATQPGDSQRELPLLKAACAEYPNMSTDIANVSTAVRDALFPRGRKEIGMLSSKLSSEPFEAGYDRELVRAALGRMITMDPGGLVMPTWTRETVVELASPIVFVSDELQIMDKMFGGARLLAGRGLLAKYGYRDTVECDVVNLLKRGRMDRRLRRSVKFVHGGSSAFYGELTPASALERPSAYRPYLPLLKQWLQDDPLASVSGMTVDWKSLEIPLDDLIGRLEAAPASAELPSLAQEVARAFEKELAAQGGTEGKIKHCREVLKDPRRMDFFRQMAALTQLAGMLGPSAVGDVVPYLGSAQWRVREHAHKQAVGLVKAGGARDLVALMAKAEGANAAGILMALAEGGAGEGLAAARAALQHKDEAARKAAVQALATLGGANALTEVLAFMGKAGGAQELWGCELALLSRQSEPAFAGAVRTGAIAMLPKATPAQRRSLAYVLGQLGGPESLAALNQAFRAAPDDEDRQGIAEGLSYSPDRAADALMLELAKSGGKALDAVASVAVRRMVGPNGVGDVTDAQRMDLAEALLNRKPEARLIMYLGKVHTGRCLQFLTELMKQGNAALVAGSIIAAAEGMEKPPDADAKIAADALAQVIEYIEVSYLRGGAAAHMNKEDNYAGWKSTQARAGKAMLKLHKPKAAVIPTFSDKDLDL